VGGDEERQGCDRPAIRSEVTAPRAQLTVCPACGRANTGALPAAVTPAVPYGPIGPTWASYCTTQQHIPVERTTEILADLGPHRVSDATVLQASEPLDRGIAPSTEAVQGMVREAAGLPGDASGLRVTGKWYGRHVACTARLPSYEGHAKRGHKAMDDAGILGAFHGPAVQDPWQPYWHDDACAHALCHAPHLRALRLMAQPYQQAWATDLAELLRESNAAGEVPPAPALHVAPPVLEAFAKRYDAVVQAGCEANPASRPPTEGAVKKRGRPQPPPPGNWRIRLRDFTAQRVACMTACRLPCDNNQGARDIRMVTVTQKVSGGFRPREGAQPFGRIRGDISTARKHAKNVFEAISDALDGRPFIPSSDMQYRPSASEPSTYLSSYI
jgi:transposase